MEKVAPPRRIRCIDLTEEACEHAVTPGAASEHIREQLSELEQFAGLPSFVPCRAPLPEALAELQADLMISENVTIPRRGVSRALPKSAAVRSRAPRAKAKTSCGGGGGGNGGGGRGQQCQPKSSAYKLAISRAWHRAWKQALDAGADSAEAKRQGTLASKAAAEALKKGLREY